MIKIYMFFKIFFSQKQFRHTNWQNGYKTTIEALLRVWEMFDADDLLTFFGVFNTMFRWLF